MAAVPVSDAIVFFGATGDLAYKQIFPALQALVARERLSVPIIGVAKAGWGLEQLRERARDSIRAHSGFDEGHFQRLSQLLLQTCDLLAIAFARSLQTSQLSFYVVELRPDLAPYPLTKRGRGLAGLLLRGINARHQFAASLIQLAAQIFLAAAPVVQLGVRGLGSLA